MPFNTTEEEREKNIKRDHADKLKFERPMKREINAFLERVLADFKASYILSGRTQDFAIYEDDIKALLRKTYLEVSDSFSDRIRKGLLQNAEEDEGIEEPLAGEEEEEEDGVDVIPFFLLEPEESTRDFLMGEAGLALGATIREEIREFINQQVEISANSILNTTNKDLNKALGKAIIANQGELGVVGFTTQSQRSKVANDAAVDFRDTFPGREGNISMSEVENASEGSKFKEAIAVVATVIVRDKEKTKKIWITMLDGRQRPSHDAASGQTVPIDQPFIVQGEFLNFPRDSSLGATLSNLARCRCEVTYVIP